PEMKEAPGVHPGGFSDPLCLAGKAGFCCGGGTGLSALLKGGTLGAYLNRPVSALASSDRRSARPDAERHGGRRLVVPLVSAAAAVSASRGRPIRGEAPAVSRRLTAGPAARAVRPSRTPPRRRSPPAP